ncbi:MAG: LON peptidase substrate-binding domain-containing protein, partial [Longimicrobiales bacterium]
MPLLVRAEDQVDIPERLPVVALRDLVFFPYVVLPILIGRRRSVAALDEAKENGNLVVLVAQKDPGVDDPGPNEIFRVGTIARLVQVSQLPDGTSRVVLEGLGRARIKRLTTTTEALRATVEPFVDREAEPAGESPDRIASLARSIVSLYGEYARLHERIPEELASTLSAEGDRVRLAHLVSGHIILPSVEKQEILESTDLGRHLELLREILVRELEILRIERKLDRQIQLQLGGPAPFDFAPGLKAIHREPANPEPDEWAELTETITNADLPPQARVRAEKELSRLRKLNPVAPEAAVIRTHLDWIVALPWAARSKDSIDVRRAASVLEAAHFGLTEVKERILDHVAVLSL